MAICATYNAMGQVSIVLPAPADLSACTLLIPTADDHMNSPFTWSAADGSTIAVAIVGVWAVGFVSRALIRALKS